MPNTTAAEVIASFESSFQDKCVIPIELELLWLRKAVAQYGVEICELNYNQETSEFSTSINPYIIDTLAQMMKVYYQEREVSKVNKRVSIVGKDLSIDGNNGSKTAAKNELDYNAAKMSDMVFNQKHTAYN
ncbi:MAG: hypothetical protein KH231_06190 [Dialister sp.]|uniref:hypothetical protein n=1 Tax=Dialister sp. TaxID=1955814 RepID=UPI001D9884B2|nr:hypothetical protein [Dialister sp.]MBS6715046.1 hypothetical protein [Dialister sp.]